MTGAEKYLKTLLEQKEYINNMISHRTELIEKARTVKTVDTSIERVQTSHNIDRICSINNRDCSIRAGNNRRRCKTLAVFAGVPAVAE